MTSMVSSSGRPLMKKTSACSAASARPGSDSPPTYSGGGSAGVGPDQRGLAATVADRDMLPRPEFGDDSQPLT